MVSLGSTSIAMDFPVRVFIKICIVLRRRKKPEKCTKISNKLIKTTGKSFLLCYAGARATCTERQLRIDRSVFTVHCMAERSNKTF